MSGKARTASVADGGAEAFLIGILGDDVHNDSLSGERMRFSANATISDAGDGEYDGLDFSWHEFLSTDIDHLAHAT